MQYQATQNRVSLLRRARRFLNGLGRSRHCCICQRTFLRFSKFRGGWQALSPYLRQARWTGSDFDNFWCPFCRCHDRERHLTLFFERLELWERFEGAAVLHLAPEKHLARRIEECAPERYVKGDLAPSREGVERIDVTALPFADASFDWVICNHVLEHVPDDVRALAEIWRVLRPGGGAILQTPYAAALEASVENPEIVSAAQRLEFYGQEDHVRLYGRDLFERIRAAGFELELRSHAEWLPHIDAARYGVNQEEPLFWCIKPQPPMAGQRHGVQGGSIYA